MKVYGVTGGVGTGKSTFISIVREMGYTVIDTDAIAKEISISVSGLSYKKLQRKFFNDFEFKKNLEQQVHPKVKYKIIRLLIWYCVTGKAIVFIEIPLLFELHYNKCMTTIVIECSTVKQKQRNRGAVYFNEKISYQMPLDSKIKMADIVISNEGTKEDLRSKVKKMSFVGTCIYSYVALFLVIGVLAVHLQYCLRP